MFKLEWRRNGGVVKTFRCTSQLSPMDAFTRDQAAVKVLDHVAPEFLGIDDIIINEPDVLENESAWVFPYNSQRFLDSGDINFALMSNNPVLVCKRTGELHTYPGALSAEDMLEAFTAGQ